MGELAELIKSGKYKPQEEIETKVIVPKKEESLLDKVYFWSGLQGLEQLTRVPGQMGKGAILEQIQEGEGISSILKGYGKGALRSLKGDFITRPEVQEAKGEVREEGIWEATKDIAYDLIDDSYLFLTGIGEAKLAKTAPGKVKALQKAAIAKFVPEIEGLGKLEFIRGGLPVQRVMQQTKETQNLYQNTIKLKRFETVFGKEKKKVLNDFLVESGIYDKKGKVINDELFEEFWFYAEHGHELKPEEVAQISEKVKWAADGIRSRVGDVLHGYAKKTAPDLGYWVGHVPHYYAIGEHTDEWKKIETARKQLPEINNLSELRNRQAIMRGKGGYFGSINKERIATERTDYSKAYKEVMENYIDGVLHKGFKDRWKPLAIDTIDVLTKKANLAKTDIEKAKYEQLIDYLWGGKEGKGANYWDIVTGQAEINKNIKWKVALEKVPGLRGLEKPASQITDFLTGFNYIAKLGVSYVRFPLVNLTQPLLTTLPAAGTKAFRLGMLKAVTGNKEYMELCKQHGVFDPVMRAITERGITGVWEKYASIPQRASESWNRWLTFCVGMEKAKLEGKGIQAIGRVQEYNLAKGGLSAKVKEAFREYRGLKAAGSPEAPRALEKYNLAKQYFKENKVLKETIHESPRVQAALDLVDLCQFPYFKHTMPQWSTTSGFGKIAMQFRSFSSFYIQFLMEMKRRGPKEFAKAMGGLVGLSGLGFIPYYKYMQEEALRVGIDLPDPNILKEVTKAAGVPGGIDIGSSMEPFNPPQQTSWLLGPTWGPLAEAFFPGESDIGKVLEGISPPVTRMAKYMIDKKIYTDAEEARYLGDRSIVEALYLKPSFESRRYRILSQMEAAIQGGRSDVVRELLKEAKEEGIRLDLYSPSGKAGKDLATINARIKKRSRMLRGKTEKVVKKAIKAVR